MLYKNLQEDNGNTIEQNNLSEAHSLPLGTLVEITIPDSDYNHMRGYIVHHERDCDGEPLYAIGPKGYERHFDAANDSEYKHIYQNQCWSGFSLYSLRIID